MLEIPRDFKVGEKRKVVVNGEEVLLIYLGADRFVAVSNRCTHLKCDLSKVGAVIREELVCQCHFTRFSLTDGRVLKGPARSPLKVYRVEVRPDKVVIYP
jgi:nitrite reductase/ring-hydroxylating ferredoxin subunit